MKTASKIINILSVFINAYIAFFSYGQIKGVNPSTLSRDDLVAYTGFKVSIYSSIIMAVVALGFTIYLFTLKNDKKPSTALCVIDLLFGSFLGGIFALLVKPEESKYAYAAPQQPKVDDRTPAMKFVEEKMKEAETEVNKTSNVDKDNKR